MTAQTGGAEPVILDISFGGHMKNLWTRVRQRMTLKKVALTAVQVVCAILMLWAFVPFVLEVFKYREQKARIELISARSSWGSTMESEVEWLESWAKQGITTSNEFDTFLHQKSETIRHLDRWGLELQYSPGAEADSQYANRLVAEQRTKIEAAYQQLRAKAVTKFGEAQIAAIEKNPQVTAYIASPSLEPVYSQALMSFLWSCLAMWPLLLCKVMRRGYKVWYELMPHRSPLAALLWPVASWFYPLDSPVNTTLKALRFATGVIITLLTWGAGGQAFAQGKKGKSGRNKTQSALIITTNQRIMPIGDALETTHRITILRGNVGVEEVVGVVDNSRAITWSSTLTPLYRVFGNPHLTVNALGGWRHLEIRPHTTNARNTIVDSAVFGGQIFLKTSRFSALTPVLRIENPITANQPSIFAWNTKARAKLGSSHFWSGVDAAVRKPLADSKPTSWTIGGVLDYQKRKWLLGGGIFRNQTGAMGARMEFQYTF